MKSLCAIFFFGGWLPQCTGIRWLEVKSKTVWLGKSAIGIAEKGPRARGETCENLRRRVTVLNQVGNQPVLETRVSARERHWDFGRFTLP